MLIVCFHAILNHFSARLPNTEKKKPCQELATIGGALHSLLGFLFAVSSMQEEKTTRPHHQNSYFSILLVTVSYPLLSSGLSF